MPYPTPNLTTLQQQALSDIQSADITDLAGNQVTGLLQKSVLRVLALVQAGFAYLHFRYLDYIALQTNPFTATGEWLAAWMALKGVTRLPASAATGTATFTGTNTFVIPNGTPMTRGDNAQFVSTAAGTITSGSATVNVQALVAGSAGTIVPGTGVAISSPINGISSQGTFASSIEVGADQETDDSLRTRGLLAYASPPQGGAASDYVEWALQVPGVTRAWVDPNYNSITGSATNGVVSVLFMEDVVRAAEGGIPQGTNGCSASETRNTGGSGNYPLATGDQLALANYIYPLRPVTALVLACAPAASPVNYTIANLSPDTGPIVTAIEGALQDMHTRLATPGGTIRPDGLPGGELYESDWTAAIKSVPGVLAFDVTSPTGTIASATGTIFILGTVTAT
jgi:uncharacterized phage protein gp47/JayE